MLTPPPSPSSSPSSQPPVSPSYSTTSILPPPSSPLPSPRSSTAIGIPREASPARGTWTADRPRQKRSSFVDRARMRMRESWHLNMQKAGVRPMSSFEVVEVRKGYVKDVAAEWSIESPAASPIASPVVERGRSEGRGRRVEDFTGLEGRVRRHQVKESLREMKRREEEKEKRVERARGLSFDAHAAGIERADSLFLAAGGRPTSETFFASDWSQKQVIDQAKEMVAELPASSSFHKGPFGEKSGKVSGSKRNKQPTSSDQGLRTRKDDRRRLPSQDRRVRSRIPVRTRPTLSRRDAMP
ncbi:hypothetical protein F4805DRAFT_431829 [Annulohypoxylon moriforme]|nr:hypothetical protein F4805DRAFT_431829 [Annulohypoxylon moriforme]